MHAIRGYFVLHFIFSFFPFSDAPKYREWPCLTVRRYLGDPLNLSSVFVQLSRIKFFLFIHNISFLFFFYWDSWCCLLGECTNLIQVENRRRKKILSAVISRTSCFACPFPFFFVLCETNLEQLVYNSIVLYSKEKI